MIKMLAVDRNTWHYRYYIFIRNFWYVRDEPNQTSLCPYVQTMLWFSLGMLILSPLVIAGWIMMKMFRTVYKFLDYMGFERLCDLLDATPAGASVANASTRTINTSPLLAMMEVLVGAIMTVVVLAILSASLGAVGIILYKLPEWPSAIYEALISLFSYLFIIMASIGCAVTVAGQELSRTGMYLWELLTSVPMWSMLGTWVIHAITLALLGATVPVILYGLSRTSIGRRFIDFLIFHKNGYDQARLAAQTRRALAEALQDKKPPRPPNKFLVWFKSCFKRDVVVNTNKSHSILGFFGLVWETILVFKRKACPIVEFVGSPINESLPSNPSEYKIEEEIEDDDEEEIEDDDEKPGPIADTLM